MKRLIVLGGPCGAGKTTLRTTDPELKDLPYLDIHDVYVKHPGIHYNDAFYIFVASVAEALNKNETTVLEAHFKPGGFQEAWLNRTMYLYGWGDEEVEFRYLDIDPLIATKRILEAYEENQDREYTEARLRMTWGKI